FALSVSWLTALYVLSLRDALPISLVDTLQLGQRLEAAGDHVALVELVVAGGIERVVADGIIPILHPPAGGVLHRGVQTDVPVGVGVDLERLRRWNSNRCQHGQGQGLQQHGRHGRFLDCLHDTPSWIYY